jgi:guanylate kinase
VKNTRSKGLVFVVSGPSGSGKTTLVSQLLKDRVLGKKITKSVSLTTRKKRLNEKNGRDYFFISQNEFKDKLRDKKILEWTRYLGYYYATPKELVDRALAEGKSIILCLDTVGASRIKRFYPRDSRTIFVKPPSIARLRERIVSRGKTSGEREFEARLRMAKGELRLARSYDYRIVNDILEKSVQSLKKIIEMEINKRARG